MCFKNKLTVIDSLSEMDDWWQQLQDKAFFVHVHSEVQQTKPSALSIQQVFKSPAAGTHPNIAVSPDPTRTSIAFP